MKLSDWLIYSVERRELNSHTIFTVNKFIYMYRHACQRKAISKLQYGKCSARMNQCQTVEIICRELQCLLCESATVLLCEITQHRWVDRAWEKGGEGTYYVQIQRQQLYPLNLHKCIFLNSFVIQVWIILLSSFFIVQIIDENWWQCQKMLNRTRLHSGRNWRA